MTIHANVTAYKGYLCIELLATASIPGECHISADNPTVFGQVINNTKEHLGVSDEAFELLKKVKPGRSSLGELDWFQTGAIGQSAFGWLGGPYKIVDPYQVEASRQWCLGEYTKIDNTVPEGAIEAIDTAPTVTVVPTAN